MKHLLFTKCFLLSVTAFCQTPQSYTSFDGDALSLYAWNGNKMMLLSYSDTLNPTIMNKWVLKMDTAYNYYVLCTGSEPIFYTGVTYFKNRSTIAEVPSTCGAGCSYVGWTGIEMESSYFMNMYNYIYTQNLYDQIPFYELGRNFWFYDAKLGDDDPVVTGYAVFMRFMAMEAAHVQGAPFGSWTFSEFKNKVINLLPSYMADQTLNWDNTLGIGEGVPNSDLGATDLFASFCFYLRDNYCGNHWVENVWKFAGLRPDGVTTQDKVDNFIIASSQAANTNLTSLFQQWKWTISANAIAYLNSLNLGVINLQPSSINADAGSSTFFEVSSSDVNAYFQWQVNAGSGFQNVINGGHYSGANADSLIVSNVSIADHNNNFRCIVTVGTCTDTSVTSKLTVNNITGFIEKDRVVDLSVFPNPFGSKIFIEVSSTEFRMTGIQIYDLLGRKVYDQLQIPIFKLQFTIDLSDLVNGMYFLKIKTLDSNYFQQIIKQ